MQRCFSLDRKPTARCCRLALDTLLRWAWCPPGRRFQSLFTSLKGKPEWEIVRFLRCYIFFFPEATGNSTRRVPFSHFPSVSSSEEAALFSPEGTAPRQVHPEHIPGLQHISTRCLES